MRESTIEARLRKAVERAGGRCLKWVCPGHTGVPDRIIIMPGGRVYFAELKAPGEKERARQEYVQQRLRKLGCTVFSSVDSVERTDEVMQELLDDQTPTNGDVIRAMDDEELARYLRNVQIGTLAAQLGGTKIDSEEKLRLFLAAVYEEEEQE